MFLTHWLAALPYRLRAACRPRITSHRNRRIQPAADIHELAPRGETLEDRTLLTVTSSFDAFSGVLTVNADAADNVTLTASGGNVKINGADPDDGVRAAASVLQIDVFANGNFANTLDASGVTAVDFTSLFGIRLAGGEGNDILIGSPLTDTLEGGDGNDQLTGGAGDDQYEFFIGAGTSDNDVIDESGGGNDFVCLFTESGGATLDLSNAAAKPSSPAS